MNIKRLADLISALKPNCSDYVYVSKTVAVALYGTDYVVTNWNPDTGITHEVTTSTIANAAQTAMHLIESGAN